jgi:DNA-binding MurR/RpiR family transcriptional regulator
VRHTLDAARYARSRGARIVAITDSELSPLSALADETIMVQTDTPSFFHTMAPAFAAVECLAALVAARHGPTALATLEASEDQLAAFGTYVMPKKGRHRK